MKTLTYGGDIWSKLEFDLSEFRDLFNMRLETKEEAIGERVSRGNRKTGKKAKWRHTAPRWEAEDHGKSVRAWLIISYVDAIDQESLQECLEAGKRLLPSVEQRFAAKDLTPELLNEWGLLNRWAGAIQLAYHAKSDAGRLRGNDSLEGHKRWYAHYFLRIYKHGQIENARDEMERFINTVFDELPEGDEKDWFKRYFSDSPSDFLEGARRLTGAFRQLSAAELKRVVKLPAGDIPSLELDFPPP